jgi:hypothetical protein
MRFGLPPATTNINGKWSLYVIDTNAGNRGVISGCRCCTERS